MVAMEKDMAMIRRSFSSGSRSDRRILTSRVYRGKLDPQGAAVVGPMCGAPYAVMILENLIILGAQDILFLGWCGSIQPDLLVGDFLVPDYALSEEGTSAHYPTKEHHPTPSSHVLKAIEDGLLSASIPFRKGAVWSMDAPYRETREKVLLYQEQSVLGVEMELSALFAVASFRQVNLGAILVVSDELGTLSWKSGFASPKFNRARKLAAEVIPTICQRIRNAQG